VGERDEARGVDLLAEALTGNGPQPRTELRDRLTAAGIPVERQALYHLFLAASLRGHLVRGPVVDGEQLFVAPARWLGAPPAPLEREAALARLARRYLAGHGPAGAPDLAKWVGLPLRDARAALAEIDEDLDHLPDGLVDLGERVSTTCADAPPRLLGPFDPLLLGWASREEIVGPHRSVVTTNGLFRPFALVDGRAVATWSLAADRLRIQLLEPVPAPAVDALIADAADVRRYLGLPPGPPPELRSPGTPSPSGAGRC
jgi:hypothetical protein